MPVPRSGGAFTGVAALELLVLRIRNQIARDIKTTDRHMRGWVFIGGRIFVIAAHDEFARWNKNHHSPKRVREVGIAGALQISVVLELRGRRFILNRR